MCPSNGWQGDDGDVFEPMRARKSAHSVGRGGAARLNTGKGKSATSELRADWNRRYKRRKKTGW